MTSAILDLVLPDQPVSCDFTADSRLPVGCKPPVLLVGWTMEAGDPFDTIVKLYHFDHVLRT